MQFSDPWKRISKLNPLATQECAECDGCVADQLQVAQACVSTIDINKNGQCVSTSSFYKNEVKISLILALLS